jgi:hypothetical protein
VARRPFGGQGQDGGQDDTDTEDRAEHDDCHAAIVACARRRGIIPCR